MLAAAPEGGWLPMTDAGSTAREHAPDIPAWRRPLPLLAASLTALTLVAMFAREALGIGGSARPWLLAASTGFMLTCLFAGALSTRPGRVILLALVACWLGDYFGSTWFIASVAAFGAAHLLLIGAFATLGLAWRRVAAASAPVVLASAAAPWWLLPHVPADQRPLIGAYMLVISAMVVCAWGVRPDRGSVVLIAAAVLFYVSDIFVARWRFVSPGPENAYLCYPLYYAACLLFALGVPPAERSSRPRHRPVPADVPGAPTDEE